MKRFAALMLCAVMLLGVLSGGGSGFSVKAAAEEAVPEGFEEEIQAQAFAISMACWYNGFEETDAIWPFFAWEATGWYAAWLYRVQGADLLPAEQASDFLQSLGMPETLDGPENWLGEKAPSALRSTDGSVSYDFREHKLRLEELLGVEVELSMTPEAGLKENVVVTQHFGYREQADSLFVVAFEKNPNPASRFAYRFTGIEMPETEPQVDPGLTFTWDELVKANSLSNILALYPSVKIYSREYSYGGSTWLFLHENEPVILTGGDGFYSGKIHGCQFEYGETEDGAKRARISSIDKGSMASLDSFILSYFDVPALLRLDRIEGDLIWADAIHKGGYRQKLAFDLGTLVLRETVSLSEDGRVFASTVLEYQNPVPDLAFLRSWDRPLRTIKVVWESYPNGIRELRQENVEVPDDWEYLPSEIYWGDYTIYTNDQCIGDYSYPGDGVDYMLFLTTVKG